MSFFHAVPVKVFNVTEYRIKYCGTVKDAEWFDHDNAKAQEIRETVNETIVQDIIKFLAENSMAVAILDSTNPTHARRVKLKNKVGIKIRESNEITLVIIIISNNNLLIPT